MAASAFRMYFLGIFIVFFYKKFSWFSLSWWAWFTLTFTKMTARCLFFLIFLIRFGFRCRIFLFMNFCFLYSFSFCIHGQLLLFAANIWILFYRNENFLWWYCYVVVHFVYFVDHCSILKSIFFNCLFMRNKNREKKFATVTVISCRYQQ